MDLFSPNYRQRIGGRDGGHRQLTSPVSLLLSTGIALAMLVYAASRIEAFALREGDQVMSTELKNYYDDSEKFTGKDGFNVAFSIDTEDQWLLDESYGKPQLIQREWTIDDEGRNYIVTEDEISIHRCTPDELQGPNSRFYSIIEGSERDLIRQTDKLFCIDDVDSIEIWGDYHSQHGKSLIL